MTTCQPFSSSPSLFYSDPIPAIFDLFIFSDASICYTMAFPPLGNSDVVLVSDSIDLTLYSHWSAMFHGIAYDYSYADWLIVII